MKIRILDPIGVHSGMKYYMDSFIDILHSAGEDNIDVLSNYSYNGQKRFMPNLFVGNKIIKLIKLLIAGIRIFITTLFRGNNLYIILSYGTIIDFFITLCAFPAKNIIIDGHEIIHQGCERKRVYRTLFKFIYKHTKTVIIHSPRAKAMLQSLHYSGKIMYVPHFEYGIDSQYDEKNVGEDITNLISCTKINVLFFGSISYNKGIDILVNNAKALKPEIKQRLNIIVAGKATDNTLQGLDIDTSIISITVRHINDDEMKYLYSKTDFVILPYRITYQSGVLEMAFNYQKPVIVSDIPYFRTVLDTYPSFGLLTSLDDLSLQKVFHTISTIEKCGFYSEAEIYSYHHKPETSAFINELKNYFSSLN